MLDASFISLLALGFTLLLRWSFKALPGEKLQFIASVPVLKDESGRWRGVNLTYYGLFNALAYGIAAGTGIVLLGAISVPCREAFAAICALLLLCMPASRLIARVVEKKPYTFTVGGASFVGVLAAPWIITLLNRLSAGPLHPELPVIPTLAALSLCHALGEGTGRLACISFGCCYGKPVSGSHPVLRKLFDERGFIFRGATKKIAYADGMEGVPVIPIQAITSILYIGTGIAGIFLFLRAYFTSAFILAILVTQGWRPLSEILRADYRGGGKVSAYQVMGIITIVYTFFLPFVFSPAATASPDLAAGLQSLWSPGPILFLQALMVGTFFYTGRSMVTGSTVTFHVFKDRI